MAEFAGIHAHVAGCIGMIEINQGIFGNRMRCFATLFNTTAKSKNEENNPGKKIYVNPINHPY